MDKREIKFRAWNKIMSKMAYDIQNEYDTIWWVRYWIWGSETDEEPGMSSFWSYLRDDDFVVMQRTWLKDSKGKDIYENDITNNGIVKRFDWLHWDWWGSIHPGRYFDLSYNKDQELQYHTWFDDVIILWNIYENPDLLPKPTNG